MQGKTQKNIFIAFLLNALFALIELIGGLLVGSAAILSDSIHDFGDAISILLSYVLEKKSIKHANEYYTYGYARYSVLGSLFTVIVLIVGSILAIANSISRLFNPTQINYNGMILLAIVGVCVNTIAMFITSKGKSLNQKSVNLHMLEDVLGWASVLFGAIIMKFTNISIIDPLLSLCVSSFIILNACKHLKSIISVLLEKSNISADDVKQQLQTVDGVVSIHHLHIWALDEEINCATVHIVAKANQKELKSRIRKLLQDQFNISHATIELEAMWEICDNKECNCPKQKIQCTCCANH